MRQQLDDRQGFAAARDAAVSSALVAGVLSTIVAGGPPPRTFELAVGEVGFAAMVSAFALPITIVVVAFASPLVRRLSTLAYPLGISLPITGAIIGSLLTLAVGSRSLINEVFPVANLLAVGSFGAAIGASAGFAWCLSIARRSRQNLAEQQS